MTPSFLDSVLRGAEALAARDPVGALPDAELLQRFVAERDQAAFAVLVRRHGPLVWGVCRNMLPADPDAEDAFQATFLALTRSAKSIRRTEAIGGWLHGVAYRVAMRARRTAVRRKHREERAAVPEPIAPVADAAWDELQAAVHEEVSRLPEKLRVAFVLCGLQGRAQKDAAEALGWKVGTLSGRLSQARQRLIHRLACRGVPVTVAFGGAVLGATCGSAAVPALLVGRVLAALAIPDAVSPVILSLARGATHMYMTRTKILMAGLLVAGALTTGIGTRWLSLAEAQPAPKEAAAVDKGLQYLRSVNRTPAHWEYRFVPIEKPYTAEELQKFLDAADREGWEYCGSQELAAGKGGKTTGTHMVFKRLRVADRSTDASAELVKEAAKQALVRQQFAQKRELERRQAEQAALRSAETQAAAAADRERSKAIELFHNLQKARDEQELLRKKIQELERANRVGSDKAAEPATFSFALKHVKPQEATKVLREKMPGLKVASMDEKTNTIVVVASPEQAAKVKELLATLIDVAPGGKPDFVLIRLKYLKSDAAVTTLKKLFDPSKGEITFVSEPVTNGLLVTGPAEMMAAVAKVVAELDREQPSK